eukprot:TRINITY_DN6990_c0_g1_i2.p1 TRINITY_DN6990_c0_g1~~TRINITY_DN6990_c0_g1_i2.p1  ORF type:complete len:775 (+),score=197.78 TRINITY_DN6990_c0_g1_i2:58-2325(+)
MTGRRASERSSRTPPTPWWLSQEYSPPSRTPPAADAGTDRSDEGCGCSLLRLRDFLCCRSAPPKPPLPPPPPQPAPQPAPLPRGSRAPPPGRPKAPTHPSASPLQCDPPEGAPPELLVRWRQQKGPPRRPSQRSTKGPLRAVGSAAMQCGASQEELPSVLPPGSSPDASPCRDAPPRSPKAVPACPVPTRGMVKSGGRPPAPSRHHRRLTPAGVAWRERAVLQLWKRTIAKSRRDGWARLVRVWLRRRRAADELVWLRRSVRRACAAEAAAGATHVTRERLLHRVLSQRGHAYLRLVEMPPSLGGVAFLEDALKVLAESEFEVSTDQQEVERWWNGMAEILTRPHRAARVLCVRKAEEEPLGLELCDDSLAVATVTPGGACWAATEEAFEVGDALEGWRLTHVGDAAVGSSEAVSRAARWRTVCKLRLIPWQKVVPGRTQVIAAAVATAEVIRGPDQAVDIASTVTDGADGGMCAATDSASDADDTELFASPAVSEPPAPPPHDPGASPCDYYSASPQPNCTRGASIPSPTPASAAVSADYCPPASDPPAPAADRAAGAPAEAAAAAGCETYAAAAAPAPDFRTPVSADGSGVVFYTPAADELCVPASAAAELCLPASDPALVTAPEVCIPASAGTAAAADLCLPASPAPVGAAADLCPPARTAAAAADFCPPAAADAGIRPSPGTSDASAEDLRPSPGESEDSFARQEQMSPEPQVVGPSAPSGVEWPPAPASMSVRAHVDAARQLISRLAHGA